MHVDSIIVELNPMTNTAHSLYKYYISCDRLKTEWIL